MTTAPEDAENAESMRRIQAIRDRRRLEIDAQRAQARRDADGPDFWSAYAQGEEAQAQRDAWPHDVGCTKSNGPTKIVLTCAHLDHDREQRNRQPCRPLPALPPALRRIQAP